MLIEAVVAVAAGTSFCLGLIVPYAHTALGDFTAPEVGAANFAIFIAALLAVAYLAAHWGRPAAVLALGMASAVLAFATLMAIIAAENVSELMSVGFGLDAAQGPAILVFWLSHALLAGATVAAGYRTIRKAME